MAVKILKKESSYSGQNKPFGVRGTAYSRNRKAGTFYHLKN